MSEIQLVTDSAMNSLNKQLEQLLGLVYYCS